MEYLAFTFVVVAVIYLFLRLKKDDTKDQGSQGHTPKDKTPVNKA